jgi:probable rRNA maturation factor
MAEVDVDDRRTGGAEGAAGDVAPPVAVDALVAQAQFLLDHLGLHPETELAISLVDVAEMAALHEQWLDLPGPTDVLSFPMDQLRVPEPGGAPAEPGVLGDVVLCPQVAAEQGAAAGHGTMAELELLLTHGILHLLGHDHAEPEEHAVMFGLQDQLLAAWRASGAARPAGPADGGASR